MMKDISLALLAPEFLPNWGGVGTYCVEITRHLANKLDLHVITLTREIKGSEQRFSKEDMLDYYDNKVNIHILTKAKDTFLYNLKFQYSILRELPKLQKNFGLDIVHSHHAHMSDVLYKIKEKRPPTVTTIHTTIGGQRDSIEASGLPFNKLSPSEKWQVLLYKPLLRFEKYSLERCENFITVSNWMRNVLWDNYPNISRNITPIYNGIDPSRYSPEKSKNNLDVLENINEPIVLFSSRLTTAKGAHFLIKAIPKIIENNKNVHFVFTGAGDKGPWISLMKKYNIGSDYYTFLGYLDYEDLPTLYAKASIYLLPTLYENFPFRMIEAMACGTPVIGTNICAIPEAIENGKNGLLIPTKNDKAIANGVLRLLEDEIYLKKLGENARKTVLQKFSWENIINSIMDVYEKSLDNGN
jgi:glycosyltransferase involved in cell wall biosynthesis